MANEYVTVSELKASLTMGGTSFADADLALAAEAASRSIDNVTGRRFYSDADADQQRFYSAASSGYLRIDDLVELTALETDPTGDGSFPDAWTANTDFTLEPLNADALGRPFDVIRLRYGGGYRFSPYYTRSIRVTGKFGWPAVPPEIKQAASILAARLLVRGREAPFGIVTVGVDEGAAMRIARTDPDVAVLTGPYVRNAALIV